MIDYSMLQEFITEAGEHLNEMETDLLQLEMEPDNQEILNDIFREIHSVKGAAEYVGLKKISELAHKLENLLEKIRQGKTTVDSRIVDVLIEARDRMVQLIHDLESDKTEKTEISDVLQNIRQFSDNDESSHMPDDPSGNCATFHSDPHENVFEFEDAQKEENNNAENAVDENYEEEHDAELFEIFLDQLKDRLSSIYAQTGKLNHAHDLSAMFVTILKDIGNLRTSANYMGYESLVNIYARWEDDIIEVLENIALGLTGSFKFMDDYLEMILVRFPQVRQVVTETICPEPGDPPRVAEDNVCEQDTPEDLSVMEEVEKKLELFQDDTCENREKEQNTPEQRRTDPPPESGFVSQMPENEVLFNEKEFGQVDPVKIDDLLGEEKLQQSLDLALDDALKNMNCPLESIAVEDELFSPVDVSPQQLPISGLSGENGGDGIAGDEYKKVVGNTDTESAQNEENDVSEKDKLHDITQEVLSRRQKEIFDERLVKKTLRVDSHKIDSLMNQVGELVVSRAWFSQLFSEMKEFQQYLKENIRLEKKEMKQVRGLTFRLSEATINLGRVANELQEGIMKVRMLPVAHLFNRYPRLVRDLVKGTFKNVRVEIKGEDTELDKMIIEEISDPLVHIIRNAVDHGIEAVEERKLLGKPHVGTVTLEAYHESNHVVIEVKDDGRGIDPEKIKHTALEKGFVDKEELAQMTQKEIISLITKPGFSTTQIVTHTSGRGVGMDVVKKNVEKLNGNMEIDSLLGKQTRFRIKIPLTLAIIPALMVRVADDFFTIPLTNVEETLRIFSTETTIIEGTEVIYLRDTVLPLVRLSELFHREMDNQNSDKQFVVVVSTGLRRVGLIVDALVGQEEVVIKPLVDYLQESSGFSGATILGDGRISLILDIYELVNLTLDRRTQQLASISHSV